MSESWRRGPDHGRVMRSAPDTKTGGLGDDQPVIDVVPTMEGGQEVYVPAADAVRALEAQSGPAHSLSSAAESEGEPPEPPAEPPTSAASFRERPKGKGKEAKTYLKDLSDTARAVGTGGKVASEADFLDGLAKYAEIRTRRPAADALLGATADLNVRDVQQFRDRVAALEASLIEKGFLKAENESGQVQEVQAPAASTASASGAPAPEAPKQPDIVEPPEEDANAIPPHFETAYKKLIEKFRKDGTRREDQIPLASKGIISNSEYEAFKKYVQERDGAAEREKRQKKEAAKKEAPKAPQNPEAERQARLQARAEEFNTRGRADMDKAADIFVEIRDSLAPEDVDTFVQKVRDLDWDINGDVHAKDDGETAAHPYLELIPLGNTPDALTKSLGKPAGRVENFPYWVLEDGDGVLLSGGPAAERVPQRFGEGGFTKIRDTNYEYRAGAFHKITDAEVARRREEMKKAPRKAPEAPAEPATPAAETAATPAAAEATETSPGGAEKKRSYNEGLEIFTRAHVKEKKREGVAFREAIKGMSKKDRARLLEFVVKTTSVPRNILERIHDHVEQDHKKNAEAGKKEQETQLEREIEEDVKRILGRAPEGQRKEGGRNREDDAQRLEREIADDIAKILAKK